MRWSNERRHNTKAVLGEEELAELREGLECVCVHASEHCTLCFKVRTEHGLGGIRVALHADSPSEREGG